MSTATAEAASRDFREIYSLYKELHANMTGGSTATAGRDNAWKLLFGRIAQPQTIDQRMPYDEATLQARCCAHIAARRRPSDVAEFRRMNEALAACVGRQKHQAVLTLLLQTAEDAEREQSAGAPAFDGRRGQSDIFSSTSVGGLRGTYERSLSLGYGSGTSHLQHSGTTVSASTSRGTLPSPAAVDPKLLRLSRCATTPALSRGGADGSATASFAHHNGSPAATHARIPAAHPTVADLVQDVIYALGGVAGRFLRKDIISGVYKLDPKSAGSLSASQAAHMMRLTELGYYHDRVVEFLNPAAGRTPLGLMGQGLCTMIQTDLTNYYGFVAMLQDQFNEAAQPLTLIKLHMLTVQPLHRFNWLANIAESCQTQKGGELASTVAAYRSNGDADARRLVDEMLVACCGPLQQMLAGWLLEGEINDPHAEFFIETLPDVGPDRLWSDKYRVRRAQLPSFISEELANKVLVTGKSVNFLREVCRDQAPVRGREELLQCLLAGGRADGEAAERCAGAGAGGEEEGMLFAVVPDTRLHRLIERVYLNTSKRVLDMVMGEYKLLQHLKAMRNYLLLGQGDFVGNLIENLKPELDRPARDLHQYELATILDTAIRATNAQFDDPEVIKNLEVRLMGDFEDDLGWDTFTLRYSVTGPLSTMLEQSMTKYQQLFKPLWRMKHLELVLCARVWKEQMCQAKLLRSMHRELAATAKRLHLVTHQMVHFIHQMLYYILFEVIECQWTTMLSGVRKARTLDDIFEAHDLFLREVRRDAFLENDDEIYLRMSSVFNAIGKLEGWQYRWYELCGAELEARRRLAEEVRTSERRGEFGVTGERQAERDAEHKAFRFSLVQMHEELDKIGVDYEMCVRKFLLLLACSADANIQLFGTRLDFNEYYKRRDEQLDVPLTFATLRQSMMYTSKNGMSWSGGSAAFGN